MGTQICSEKRGQVFYIPARKLTVVGKDTPDGPAHPLYDARVTWPLDPAMVASIAEFGVIQPIRIRKNGEDVFEVVAGRRRVLHTRAANDVLAARGEPEALVPCVFAKDEDARLFAMSVAENEIRVGDSHVNRARKMARLMSLGRTEDDVAVTFGLAKRTVQMYLAVLDLHPHVHAMLDGERLGLAAAASLARLPRAEQVAAMDKLLGDGNASREAVTREVRARKARPGAPAPYTLPSRGVLRKLAASEYAATLPPDVVRAVRWILGDLPPDEIDGLAAMLDHLAETRKPGKKAEPAESAEAPDDAPAAVQAQA